MGVSLLRGTCHMLSESGLKQKPVIASRTGSQTLPFQRGGGEAESEGWRLCVEVACVFVCSWQRLALS